MTLTELIAAAKEAVKSGDLEQAEKLTKQAQALKAIEALEPEAAAVKSEPVRLPFATSEEQPAQPSADAAVKSWYVRKFGDIDTGADQVARELYGSSYAQAAYYKHADYLRYLRSGNCDPRLERQVLLTQEQIMDAVANGVSAGAIKATMVEAQDDLGGYLVPEDRRNQIVARLAGITVVRPRANVITTSRDRVSMPKETGGTNRYQGATRVTWVDEQPSSSAADTNMTFGEIGIPVHTAMASVTLSQNLLEDNAFNLDAYLTGRFATDFGINEDEQFLVGTGVGRPQGVLLNNTSGGPSSSDITTVNSGNASAILAESGTPATKGLIAIPYNLDAQYRANAVWVFNRATALAIRALKDGSGQYLWATKDGQLSAGQMATLLGYGIAESEAMPGVSANYYAAIFGDWSGYTIADRIGLSIKRYEDFTTGRQNQVGFVARRRLGGQVSEPWKFVVLKVAA